MANKKNSIHDTQEINFSEIPTYTLPENNSGSSGDIYIGKQRLPFSYLRSSALASPFISITPIDPHLHT